MDPYATYILDMNYQFERDKESSDSPLVKDAEARAEQAGKKKKKKPKKQSNALLADVERRLSENEQGDEDGGRVSRAF